MRDLADVPGGSAEWSFDNPFAAATEFLERNPEFERAPPPWPHRESELTENVSYWPGGWLREAAMSNPRTVVRGSACAAPLRR